MRIDCLMLAAVAALAPALVPLNAPALGATDGVALQYHFAGAADLAGNTNFNRAKKILTVPPARLFEDLVLDRLAGLAWNALQFDTASAATVSLRPLLDDLLQAESAASFGGRDKDHLDFVLAARVDAKTAEAWQKALTAAWRGPGDPLTAGEFSGKRWSRPGKSALWLIRARDWVVAGRGDGLGPIRDQYLKNIQQNNQPAPLAKELRESWVTLEIDWPLLATWEPLSDFPFKLGRTKLNVVASRGRQFATNYVIYPEEVPWHAEPWRTPKDLISSPLSSFTAMRDIAPYLSLDQTLSRLSSNPLTNQLFCWALQEMALQSYAAFPVADATNTLQKLGAEAPAILNPALDARNHAQVSWNTKNGQFLLTHLQLTSPTLKPAHDKNGDFLEASVFPLEPKFVPAPEQLLSQIEKRDDLIYYDWELTGLRLMQWRLLTEVLPVFPPPTPADVARRQKAEQDAKPPVMANAPRTPMAITDAWLQAMSSPILNNSVTEVTRRSPTELKIVRNSQFVFTGLELVALSHWLADAPVGPIDYNLLPKAKMTGPGLPPARH